MDDQPDPAHAEAFVRSAEASATAASRSAAPGDPDPRRPCTRNSAFPAGPSNGDAIAATTAPPADRIAPATDASDACQAPGSVTTPPFPTASLPASNCGFTSATRSASG